MSAVLHNNPCAILGLRRITEEIGAYLAKRIFWKFCHSVPDNLWQARTDGLRQRVANCDGWFESGLKVLVLSLRKPRLNFHLLPLQAPHHLSVYAELGQLLDGEESNPGCAVRLAFEQ